MRRLLNRGLEASGRRHTALRPSAVPPKWHAARDAPKAMTLRTIGANRLFHATSLNREPGVNLSSTTTSFPTSHEKLEPVETPYFLNNQFVNSNTNNYIDVLDPATNNLVTKVPEMTDPEMKAAVASAENAFTSWSKTSILSRQQIMFRFVQLVRENFDRLAASCTIEQGKTLADAHGDVLRGIQVAEAAVNAPEFLKGELLEVAKDMETRTYREPLGVVAGICPFSEYRNPDELL